MNDKILHLVGKFHFLFALFACVIARAPTSAFHSSRSKSKAVQKSKSSSAHNSNNWFQNILSDAFTNDNTLSDVKGVSMTNKVNVKGAPVNAHQLIGTKWRMQMYLAGIPDKDPSNNLFGSKVNISTRTRQDKRFAVGVNVPIDATVEIDLELLENGVCRIISQTHAFLLTTTTTSGEWKIFDGNLLRIALNCVGYQRIVGVTGTLSKVFWSDEDEIVTRASSTYSIPAGLIYADSKVQYGVPGQFTLETSSSTVDINIDNTLGLLRVEQKVGALRVVSKMVPCGTFDAVMINEI